MTIAALGGVVWKSLAIDVQQRVDDAGVSLDHEGGHAKHQERGAFESSGRSRHGGGLRDRHRQ